SGAPAGRVVHTAVWTGEEMIIWGGITTGATLLSDGRRYNPSFDTWSADLSTTNEPGARDAHTAVWTGSEMIIWGGFCGSGCVSNTGARYNPSSNSWTSLPVEPEARSGHTAVWTGDQMIIWGGLNATNGLLDTGSRYDPVTNAWTETSHSFGPGARSLHTA